LSTANDNIQTKISKNTHHLICENIWWHKLATSPSISNNRFKKSAAMKVEILTNHLYLQTSLFSPWYSWKFAELAL